MQWCGRRHHPNRDREPTPNSVAALATTVVVRILLSWSLAIEIDGVWP
jgi:hypothetical protein